MSRFLSITLTEDCLRRAGAGDRAAQRKVYEETAGPVFALIRRLVRSPASAEDVFQDCMMCVLRQLPQFRGEAPFGAWVRQVALRQCLMFLRSPWQRARQALVAALPGADEPPLLPDGLVAHDPPLPELIDLERALARLPEISRAIVWMHDVEGMSHEQIAAHFGRSVSFSKSQLSRAHAQLRVQLAEHRPVEPALPATGVAAQRGYP
jgi:RNA polymerase sigma-70 factor (ECF subfamily)